MSEKEVHKTEPVPYFTYEGTLVRFERTIKRLWIFAIIEFIALAISNFAWILHQ